MQQDRGPGRVRLASNAEILDVLDQRLDLSFGNKANDGMAVPGIPSTRVRFKSAVVGLAENSVLLNLKFPWR